MFSLQNFVIQGTNVGLYFDNLEEAPMIILIPRAEKPRGHCRSYSPQLISAAKI